MSKNLYLNIDDDVTRIVRKISKEKVSDLTLVLPKQSQLFFDIANLKTLKERTDEMGKNVSILTMDPKGQQKALEVGFELRSLDYLTRGSRNMDVGKRTKPHRVPAMAIPAKEVIQEKIVEPVREIISELPKVSYPKFSLGAPSSQVAVKDLKKIQQRRIIMSATALGLAILLFLAFVILPHAQVVIYAQATPLSKTLELNVDQSFQAPNSQNLALPGTVIDESQQMTVQFKATGRLNKGLKAKGKVQIYNFTGQTLRLNAATTTLTAGTLTYQFESDVVAIRPTTYIAGTRDPDPASLIPEVNIIASQAGDGYNLPGGTRFEIKNERLAATNQLYARNNQNISGGTTRFSSLVTQQDIDNATTVLKASIIASIKQQLLNARGLVILDSALTQSDTNISFDKKVDEEAVNFNGTISTKVKALAYKLDDLANIVKERIEATLDPDKFLLNDSRTKTEVQFTQADLQAGKGTLRAIFQGFVASKLETDEIRESLKGKSEAEAEKLLSGISGVDSSEVLLSPFWVTTVPRFSDSVVVEVKPANP